MVIFEIIKPGNRLKLNSQHSFEVENLIHHLISTFYEANIALNLFLNERINNQIHFSTNNWENDRKLRNEIRTRIESEYDPNEKFSNYSEISNRVERELKLFKWNNGELPRDFSSKLIIIFCRNFLFSLDNFEKQLKKITEINELPSQCKEIYNRIYEEFPSLRELRNTTHHLEDRIRGEKFGKKINLQPVNNELISAPNGALILDSLINNKYGGTLGDGTYGEVEVSEDSLMKTGKILQDFLYILNWEGEPEFLPN